MHYTHGVITHLTFIFLIYVYEGPTQPEVARAPRFKSGPEGHLCVKNSASTTATEETATGPSSSVQILVMY